MTDTQERTPGSSESTDHTAALIVGVVVAAIVLIALCTVLVFRSGPGPTIGSTSQELMSTEQSCLQWSASAPDIASSPSHACRSMTDWMRQELATGAMTGAMIWGTTGELDSACHKWLASTSGIASAEWCDQMVNWMQQHPGNPTSGMMNDNMMGR